MKVLICRVMAALVFCTHVCYATDAYVVETYFVVDAKTVDIYVKEIPGTDSDVNKRTRAVTNIKEDIEYVLTETNQLLATLNTYGLNVQVTVRNLTILGTDVFPRNYLQNGNQISGGSSLKLFSDWLTNQNSYSTFNYDIALLFTGYDIFGDAGIYTQGLANVGKLCDSKNGVSVIEFNATYATALVTAHEIAHLMGASHDGIASDKVMAATVDPKHKHRWFFAECAAVDIKEFLPLVTPNCLLQTNPACTKPATSWATYKGRLFDHNVVCQRALNDTRSYACLSSNLYNDTSTSPKGDPICQQLYCQLPGTTFCTPISTPEGLICDNKKRCDNGKCVADTSAASANVDTNCVLGDQTVVTITSLSFTGTCEQFISKEGHAYCYENVIKNLCCATCKNYTTTITDCLYGDKSKRCSVLSKVAACARNNAAVCCSTCRSILGKRSTDEDREVETIKDDTKKAAIKVDEFKVKFTDVAKVTRAE